ncbi:putative oxidoreductase [Lachnellula suecica]|uniref:Putative oxidoreductase n=1 Tax=Lachnellula suecica TaxID=602035 RepID=A0A8T9CKD8_9HELO|nr:putative oxidoreductase [Lachnellula suecica]
MASYLVTGASRGIGFALIKKLSENPNNVVVAMVRNKAATESKVAAEISGKKNIFVVQGDLTDVESLKASFSGQRGSALTETEKITGGSLDILIANAGLISDYSGLKSLTELTKDQKALDEDLISLFQVNVIGNIRLFNTFLPLIKNGPTKKIATLSSGFTDEKLTVDYEVFESAPYSISKSAMNMVTAKYQAEFKKEGVIFMGVCPGTVDTGHNDQLTPKETQKLMAMGGKFAAYAPGFKGASTPDEAVVDVLNVIHGATLEKNGGQVVSHFGNRQWL